MPVQITYEFVTDVFCKKISVKSAYAMLFQIDELYFSSSTAKLFCQSYRST